MSFLHVKLPRAVRHATRTRDVRLLTVVFAAALAYIPHLCAAQEVRGRVLDRLTDQPVAAVTVQLLRGDDGDAVVALSTADDQGHFHVETHARGRYRLRVTRIGYQPVVTPPFDLKRWGDPLEVVVHVSAVAVTLAPLTIVSDRRARLREPPLEVRGYYEREERWGQQGLGMGHFLDREEIRSKNPMRVSDVVRMLRGVHVEGAGGLRQVITLRSGTGFGGRCIPAVFINGAPAANGADIDMLLHAWALTAVEVYPGLAMPGEFMNRETVVCGAIAVWTVGGTAEIADQQVRRTERAASTQFELDLVLPKESVTYGDAVQATPTLANLSDTERTVCIASSRIVVRGPSAVHEIVAQPEDGSSCVRVIELGPRASLSWHEIFYLQEWPNTGNALVQMFLTVDGQLCAGGKTCQAELLSAPRSLAVSPLRGSQDAGGLGQ